MKSPSSKVARRLHSTLNHPARNSQVLSSHRSLGLCQWRGGEGRGDKINIQQHHPARDLHLHQLKILLFLFTTGGRARPDLSPQLFPNESDHLNIECSLSEIGPLTLLDFWLYFQSGIIYSEKWPGPHCPSSEVWLTQSISQANTDWQVRILAPTTH